ncbi:hypothetical protein A9Q88_06330 [Gammaproteobacteria bacterium 50_400_T64]|nr:hypothetical protein A9Q88_06330 [Gammaproteobacteria bacterium 50_400_T64]
MDTSNLTSAPVAAYKTRSAAGTADAGQPTKAVEPGPTNDRILSTGLTQTAVTTQQSPAKQPVDVAADEKKQSQNPVQDTLRKLNDLAQTSVVFSQHEETGRTVITVSDKTTGEEIRTIPSEDFLAISAHLEESLASAEGLQPGLLVSSQA